MDSKKSYYLNITTESTIQDITILFISQSCDYHMFYYCLMKWILLISLIIAVIIQYNETLHLKQRWNPTIHAHG